MCTDPPTRDAVVGLADGYRQADVAAMIMSLRRVMRPEDVDVLLLSNVLDSQYQAWLTMLNVTLVRFAKPSAVFSRTMPTARMAVTYRFFHYLAIAETRCHRGYLFIDTRDIFFQRNLFATASASSWTDAVIFTLEPRALANHSFTPRHKAALKCLFANHSNSDGLDGIDLTRKFACSGVFGGGGPALRTFLRRYAMWLLRIGDRSCPGGAHSWIPDQMLLHAMALRGEAPNAVFSENDVYHQQQSVIARRCEPFQYITNADGSRVAAIVHHIDRSPRLVHMMSNFVARASHGEISSFNVAKRLALRGGQDTLQGILAALTQAGASNKTEFASYGCSRRPAGRKPDHPVGSG